MARPKKMTILSLTTREKRERARKSQNTDKNHGRPTEDLRQPRRDPVQNLVAAMQVLQPHHRELTETYQKIAEELIPLGVSWQYVADIWRKYGKSIIDSAHSDLNKALGYKKGAGAP
jgi:hypothetical protein